MPRRGGLFLGVIQLVACGDPENGTGGSGGSETTTSAETVTATASTGPMPTSATTTSAASSSSSTGGGGGFGGAGAGGAGDAGGAGGSGGGVCVPFSSQSCYTGPPFTEGVGLCQAGIEVCLSDGSGYGPCSDVVPAAEDCGTPAFESCTPNVCNAWSWRWPSTSFGGPVRVGAGGGRVAVSINEADPIDLGFGVVIPAVTQPYPHPDEGLVGLDAASGAPVWAKRLESLANLSAPMLLDSVVVRVDSQGRALIGGKFSATLAIDGTTQLLAFQLDRTDGFALQLGSTGAVSWSKKYGTYDQDDSGQDAYDTFSDLAVTSTDDVWVSGTINPFCPCPGGESTDYWHQLLSGADGQQLALFQSAPSPSGPNLHGVTATSVNAGGHLVSVGQRPFQLCRGSWGPQSHLSRIGTPCAPPIALTFTALDAEIDDLDETYVLGAGPTLERRDAGGNLLWSIVPPHGGRLALGPTGDLYLFGNSGGVLMLTRFDDAGGVAETRSFGTSGAVAHDIDIDETGAVYLVGRTTGDLDFGLGSMPGTANDVFVAKVAP